MSDVTMTETRAIRADDHAQLRARAAAVTDAFAAFSQAHDAFRACYAHMWARYGLVDGEDIDMENGTIIVATVADADGDG